jgi:hypothetical protein
MGRRQGRQTQRTLSGKQLEGHQGHLQQPKAQRWMVDRQRSHWIQCRSIACRGTPGSPKERRGHDALCFVSLFFFSFFFLKHEQLLTGKNNNATGERDQLQSLGPQRNSTRLRCKCSPREARSKEMRLIRSQALASAGSILFLPFSSPKKF